MPKPGYRIRAESFGTRTEEGRASTENAVNWTGVRDAARQSAGLHPLAAHVLLDAPGDATAPAPGHPVMRMLDRLVIGLSLLSGPLLLGLSAAGLCWAALQWVMVRLV